MATAISRHLAVANRYHAVIHKQTESVYRVCSLALFSVRKGARLFKKGWGKQAHSSRACCQAVGE